jgi:hypothetical protein
MAPKATKIFAEEQADVVGGCRHGADAVAHFLRQVGIAHFGRALRHRRNQRAHHVRMAADAGQAERGASSRMAR